MEFEEFDNVGTYQKAFGAQPDESLLEIFANAKACGVRERIIMVAIYTTQNAYEKGLTTTSAYTGRIFQE